MAYVRTVKTASGAIAVQIVWSTRRGSRQIEHLGSAHDDAELEALKAAAHQRLADGPSGCGQETRGRGGRKVRAGGRGSPVRSSTGCMKFSMNTSQRPAIRLQSAAFRG